MKGPTLKWPPAGRLRRTVLMLTVAGATAAGLLFTAAAAQAITGTQPGSLSLSPASGATTLTPTWSTTTACPAGYQTSAQLFELNTDGSIGSSIAPVMDNVTAPFSGTLAGPVGKLLSLGTNVKNGGTSNWVMGCFAGRAGTGNRMYVQSDKVTLSANGQSYTSSTSSTSSVTGSAQPVPWLLIGLGIVLAAAVVAGWQAWRRRRDRLDAAQAARWATEQRLPRNSANRAKPASQPQGRE